MQDLQLTVVGLVWWIRLSPPEFLLVLHSFPAPLTSCHSAFKRKTVFQCYANSIGYSSRLQKGFMQNICALMIRARVVMSKTFWKYFPKTGGCFDQNITANYVPRRCRWRSPEPMLANGGIPVYPRFWKMLIKCSFSWQNMQFIEICVPSLFCFVFSHAGYMQIWLICGADGCMGE